MSIDRHALVDALTGRRIAPAGGVSGLAAGTPGRFVKTGGLLPHGLRRRNCLLDKSGILLRGAIEVFAGAANLAQSVR